MLGRGDPVLRLFLLDVLVVESRAVEGGLDLGREHVALTCEVLNRRFDRVVHALV